MDTRKLMLGQQSLRYYANMTLGQRLFSARRRAGLSQQQVGDYLGRTKSAVCLWETDINAPSINDRVDLSKLLNIPFGDLLPEVQEPVNVTTAADPVLRQIIAQWPNIEPRLRPAVLMLCAKLGEVSTPPAARPARRLPRTTRTAAGN
jgi:transcriptional regulator with XRE-family HTH domain